MYIPQQRLAFLGPSFFVGPGRVFACVAPCHVLVD
jgi:hypothetical protein